MLRFRHGLSGDEDFVELPFTELQKPPLAGSLYRDEDGKLVLKVTAKHFKERLLMIHFAKRIAPASMLQIWRVPESAQNTPEASPSTAMEGVVEQPELQNSEELQRLQEDQHPIDDLSLRMSRLSSPQSAQSGSGPSRSPKTPSFAPVELLVEDEKEMLEFLLFPTATVPSTRLDALCAGGPPSRSGEENRGKQAAVPAGNESLLPKSTFHSSSSGAASSVGRTLVFQTGVAGATRETAGVPVGARAEQNNSASPTHPGVLDSATETEHAEPVGYSAAAESGSTLRLVPTATGTTSSAASATSASQPAVAKTENQNTAASCAAPAQQGQRRKICAIRVTTKAVEFPGAVAGTAEADKSGSWFVMKPGAYNGWSNFQASGPPIDCGELQLRPDNDLFFYDDEPDFVHPTDADVAEWQQWQARLPAEVNARFAAWLFNEEYRHHRLYRTDPRTPKNCFGYLCVDGRTGAFDPEYFVSYTAAVLATRLLVPLSVRLVECFDCRCYAAVGDTDLLDANRNELWYCPMHIVHAVETLLRMTCHCPRPRLEDTYDERGGRATTSLRCTKMEGTGPDGSTSIPPEQLMLMTGKWHFMMQLLLEPPFTAKWRAFAPAEDHRNPGSADKTGMVEREISRTALDIVLRNQDQQHDCDDAATYVDQRLNSWVDFVNRDSTQQLPWSQSLADSEKVAESIVNLVAELASGKSSHKNPSDGNKRQNNTSETAAQRSITDEENEFAKKEPGSCHNAAGDSKHNKEIGLTCESKWRLRTSAIVETDVWTKGTKNSSAFLPSPNPVWVPEDRFMWNSYCHAFNWSHYCNGYGFGHAERAEYLLQRWFIFEKEDVTATAFPWEALFEAARQYRLQGKSLLPFDPRTLVRIGGRGYPAPDRDREVYVTPWLPAQLDDHPPGLDADAKKRRSRAKLWFFIRTKVVPFAVVARVLGHAPWRLSWGKRHFDKTCSSWNYSTNILPLPGYQKELFLLSAGDLPQKVVHRTGGAKANAAARDPRDAHVCYTPVELKELSLLTGTTDDVGDAVATSANSEMASWRTKMKIPRPLLQQRRVARVSPVLVALLDLITMDDVNKNNEVSATATADSTGMNVDLLSGDGAAETKGEYCSNTNPAPQTQSSSSDQEARLNPAQPTTAGGAAGWIKKHELHTLDLEEILDFDFVFFPTTSGRSYSEQMQPSGVSNYHKLFAPNPVEIALEELFRQYTKLPDAKSVAKDDDRRAMKDVCEFFLPQFDVRDSKYEEFTQLWAAVKDESSTAAVREGADFASQSAIGSSTGKAREDEPTKTSQARRMLFIWRHHMQLLNTDHWSLLNSEFSTLMAHGRFAECREVLRENNNFAYNFYRASKEEEEEKGA
ncbi:unnamed protein product [Amoebophrya sp. A120]|nr:unnamed protein product [Amoebophrya sp. A120]|eukprot:GSA120T00025627001.1